MDGREKAIVYRAVIQCPACGFKVTERMPARSKVMTFECPACQKISHATASACCVFCLYARQQCPTAQQKTQQASQNHGSV